MKNYVGSEVDPNATSHHGTENFQTFAILLCTKLVSNTRSSMVTVILYDCSDRLFPHVPTPDGSVLLIVLVLKEQPDLKKQNTQHRRKFHLSARTMLAMRTHVGDKGQHTP